MIFTRGWELLAGVSICLIERKSKFNISDKFVNLLSLFGIFLIIISIFSFNENTRNPSMITIYPIIGSMLLILFAQEIRL